MPKFYEHKIIDSRGNKFEAQIDPANEKVRVAFKNGSPKLKRGDIFELHILGNQEDPKQCTVSSEPIIKRGVLEEYLSFSIK
ncbi:TPA: hypothetical protein ACX4EX_001701 [Yersinia enterocolitica]|uniref:hypothetical protein n=1 Tax=Yersinia enterocolitica TaxID=630 RepID=UPI0005FD0F01|nr:hypothetical protein [Yersinia enterocolitica]ELX2273922.1 hypothetical protein [Yersinia enterocolitica]ELY5261408.1 hypothetical protein [Yersinia enterocolitica]CRE88796.1 Uncharacterised protein [Yersinia enterocolitica]HDL6630340.1 hypothetical protein [Yersinia enterocolitica]HDL6656645.1 hypothetical protein [Yersinia enterocolitica]